MPGQILSLGVLLLFIVVLLVAFLGKPRLAAVHGKPYPGFEASRGVRR
jgi:hypothetical protein